MYMYIIAYTKCECFLHKTSNKCVNNNETFCYFFDTFYIYIYIYIYICLFDFLIFCTIDKL